MPDLAEMGKADFWRLRGKLIRKSHSVRFGVRAGEAKLRERAKDAFPRWWLWPKVFYLPPLLLLLE